MPRLTTLFADIADSTALFERHGNQRTRQVMQKLLAETGRLAEQHQGRLVKTIGDEALCLFASAAHAVDAAIAMQQAVCGHYFLGDDALAIRVGLFQGEVIIEPNDVYGDGVNVAARLVALANAGQILTDKTTFDSTSAQHASSCVPSRLLGPVTVKGKKQPLSVVELLWNGGDTQLTSVAQVIDVSRLNSGEILHLSQANREWLLAAADTPFRIGRAEANQLTVTSSTVSRNHGMIEYRDGQFAFTDKSSNGTWLRLGGELVRVHRGTVVLFGRGEIHCGSVYHTNQPDSQRHVIHFFVGENHHV